MFSSQIDAVRDQLVESFREQGLVDRWDGARAGIVTEFWFRQMVPPGDTSRCLAGRLDICRLLYDDLGLVGRPSWGFYAFSVSFSLVSASTSACLLWLFIRGGRP